MKKGWRRMANTKIKVNGMMIMMMSGSTSSKKTSRLRLHTDTLSTRKGLSLSWRFFGDE